MIQLIMTFKEDINMSVILLVVEQDENQMKYLPVIRKNTNLGFSEIKKRIGNGSPIMECNLFKDDVDDAKLKKLINELINVGAKIRLFDGELVKNKEVSVEYLMNRFDRYKEIQKQNEMLDDLMYGED
jgi:UDP-glucose 6-dehydrogenase